MKRPHIEKEFDAVPMGIRSTLFYILPKIHKDIVTLDVLSIRLNIPHDDGIKACGHFFVTAGHTNVSDIFNINGRRKK